MTTSKDIAKVCLEMLDEGSRLSRAQGGSIREYIVELEREIVALRKELERYRVPCEKCGGTGISLIKQQLIHDYSGYCIGVKPILNTPCPACAGKGYTDVVRVPDWFVKSLTTKEFWWETDKNNFYKFNSEDDETIEFVLTRDPDDPKSWILEEAKE